ncbi:MAG: cupin domain-containing protein [Bacteriovoracaceae bacterium]
MKALKTVLNDHSLEEFFNKFFNRLPLATSSSAHLYKDHLNWEVMESIIKEKKSILRIVKNGEMIKDYADISFQEAEDYYRNGHTLVIRHSEKSHPKLKELALEFSTFFHNPVDIQVFCSPAQTMGFGWHYDVEDVFIFQTQGEKHFTLRQNTIHSSPTLLSLPKDLGYEKEKSDLFVNVTLKAGDWLYIPSGWWHKAHTEKEGSMHISLGVLPKSAVNILTHLEKELALNPSWRTRLPLYKEFSSPDEEISFYQEGMIGLGKHLTEKMSDPEFIRSLLKSLRQGL